MSTLVDKKLRVDEDTAALMRTTVAELNTLDERPYREADWLRWCVDFGLKWTREALGRGRLPTGGPGMVNASRAAWDLHDSARILVGDRAFDGSSPKSLRFVHETLGRLALARLMPDLPHLRGGNDD